MSASRWYSSVAIIITILACGCEGYRLRNAVKYYRGEGEISYVEPVGILGPPGCTIKLPNLIFSEGGFQEFNISGAPKGGPYILFFFIPKRISLNAIADATLSVKVLIGGKLVEEFSSSIGNMWNYQPASEGDFSRLYFNDWKRLVVGKDKAEGQLVVRFENLPPVQLDGSHIVLQLGGMK